MHFTSWSAWLMIVSSRMELFPVLRSPMISSRWPRPMGIIASMALMPVWSGSFTGWRLMMPGATTSTGRLSSASISPLPSIGRPRASMTRPSTPVPTGTLARRSVRRTMLPS